MILSDNVLKKRVFKQQILDLHLKDFMIGQTTPYLNKFKNTNLQFCGLMMGDHSKCGINTMFNTGTVVGVGANIFGDGFPRNFIPSFAWGGAAGLSTFQFPKFEETAKAVMARRKLEWTDTEAEILQKVFDLSRNYRIWEKNS